jgi:hypothetical protein
MTVTPEIAAKVFKRSGHKCEICLNRQGKPQLHHVLIHRSKKHPEYDHEINLQVTCQPCHELHANAYVNQKYHYKRVAEYYGKEKVEEWLNSLNLRSRQYWD